MEYTEAYLLIGLVIAIWSLYNGFRKGEDSTKKIIDNIGYAFIAFMVIIAFYPIFVLHSIAKWDRKNIKDNQ